MKEVHLICNAHLDTIWQWTEDEGIFAAISTFRSAVNLCREYDYIFCHNEAFLYQYIKRYAPDLFEEIQQLVKEGKWHIMGGWYLQPDCNMPCGESLIRQILVGKRFFQENFGVFPTTAINFDPFGHSKGLVQIISKCGQDSYIITRPEEDKLHLESPMFHWEGFNGSRIKVNRANNYNSPLGQAAASIRQRVDLQEKDDVICVLWGVGNHGGGPSRKDLQDIGTLMKSADIRYIHSTPESFFSSIEPTSVCKESLRISMPGCYTSMSRLKHKHISLENALYYTEKICSAAALKGLMAYPSRLFEEATEDLLACEFHDVLPGTCIHAGEENGLNRIEHAVKILTDLRSHAFFALSREMEPAAEDTYPVFVFNAQPYEWKTNVCCEFSLSDQNWDETLVSQITVIDQDGNTLPSQLIKEESNLNLDWRKKIIFEATLQPLCLTRFEIIVTFSSPKANLACSELTYQDNEKIVEISPATGLISRLNINGTEYLNGDIAPMLFDDNADPWGMDTKQQKQMGKNERPFRLMKSSNGIFRNMQPIQVVEDGEICRIIEAFLEKGDSHIRLEYRIYKRQPIVDLHMDVFFSDSDRMLKLKIPTAISGQYVGQTAFGTEPLFMDGRECIFHRFVAIQRDNAGLAIFNNCQYGSSYSNNAIYLSLLRSAAYCAHPIAERPLLPENRFIKRMDQGWLTYDFRFTASASCEWTRLAQEFNQPPYALNVFPNVAIKPNPFSIMLSNKDITLEAFKKSADEAVYIIHLFNGSDFPASTELSCGTIRETFLFGAYEIKNIIFDGDSLVESSELMI